jgi:hypothetical protein
LPSFWSNFVSFNCAIISLNFLNYPHFSLPLFGRSWIVTLIPSSFGFIFAFSAIRRVVRIVEIWLGRLMTSYLSF